MHKLVPDFIQKNWDQQQNNGQFEAVCLFVDTSGFTPLTSALMAEDIAGAEVVADVLAAVFTPLVQTIYEQGGYVAGFAGDAFKAIFPQDAFPEQQAYFRAVVAAWQIKQHMVQHSSVATRFGRFDFAVKVTVSSGLVDWNIWKDETDTAVSNPGGQRAAYYFEGRALAECLEADPFAEAGEVVLTTAVADRLPQTAVTLQSIEGYQRLRDVAPATVAAYPPFPDQKLVDVEGRAAAFFPEYLRSLPTRGEFRQVVTLFVNLQSLPGEAKFASMFFRLLNQYGGYLCRVGRIGAEDPGGTLLLFWGAPHSYENNVTRALQFILDFMAAMTIPLKVGITTNLAYAGFIGAAQREEYTCYGIHVNKAARQMVAAAWGEIWLDEETSRQAETFFDLVPGAEYRFKGFTDTHSIFHLQGQREAVRDLFYRGSMVGRQVELAQLETAVGPLTEGKFGGVVTVSGEAGVGKSRLVHEFLEQTDALESANYFLCQTDDILRQSLNPFRYFLRDYFEQSLTEAEDKNRQRFDRTLDNLIAETADAGLKAELGRTRPFLGALLNLFWPQSLYEQLEPKLRFENTLAALKALIQAESLRQPLLIHLEDAHWLDADSRTFLADLTKHVDDYPFILLVTARASDQETAVVEQPVQTTIHLSLLSKTETAELAAARLHGPVSQELVDLLTERAEGNPFFVEQILLYLQEQTLLSRNGHGWEPAANVTTAAGLPMDIRAVMVSRLDRLPGTVRYTVQTASILGREFGVPVLTWMMPEETAVPIKVQAAERAVIWTAAGTERYRFQHAMLRDAAYEMQLIAQRRHLHQQAAMAIERLYKADLSPYYGELAYHCEQALDIDKALHYLKQAGDIAQSAYQNEAALDFYNRLLALLSARSARKVNGSGRTSATPRLEGAAAVLMIDAQLGKGQVLKVIGQLAPAKTALKEAIDLAETQQDAKRRAQIQLTLSLVQHDLGDVDEGLHNAKDALAFYETAGDKEAQAEALTVVARIYSYRGDHEKCLQQSQQLRQLAREAGLRYHEGQALNLIGIKYSQTGDHIRSEAHFSMALAVNQELDNKWDMAGNLNNLSISYQHQGKYDQGLAVAQQALQLNAEMGYRLGRGRILGNIALIYYGMGEFDQALFYEERAQQIFVETGGKQLVAYGWNNIANKYRLKKEYDQALAYYDQSIELFREIEKVDYYLCEPLVFKAQILFLRGEYEAAQRLNDEGVRLAAAAKQPTALMQGKILVAKLAQVHGDLEMGLHQLQALFAVADNKTEEARLHYELWHMGAGAEHGRTALDLYRQLEASKNLVYEDKDYYSKLETAELSAL